MSNEWKAALAGVSNYVASKLQKSKDSPDVKDITAEAVYQYLKYTEGAKCPVKNIALLFHISKCEMCKFFNKKRRQTEYSTDYLDQLEIDPMWSSKNTHQAELEIRDCLEHSLTEEKDKVILDLYLKGFCQSTIGDVLGLSQSTVSRRLNQIYELIKDNSKDDLT